MKYLKCSLFAVLLLLLLMTNVMEISAMDTGFSTEELSEEDRSTFISNINILLLERKPEEQAIQCFDVNENGLIAIGQEGTNGRRMLCVYSNDGDFLYGYTFNCNQSFGVEWNEKDINICFVRSDVIVTVNQEGEVLDIAKVQNTIENNTYWNHILYSTECISGDIKYTLRNDMGILNVFLPSYSQLIATKFTGEEIVLYDVNSQQLIKVLIVFIGAIVFFLIAVIMIVREFIKLKQKV